MNRLEARIGLWAAVVATALNVAFTALIAAFPPPKWEGLSAYVADYNPVRLAPVIPALILAPTILVLVTSIYYYADDRKKILARLGMMFAAPYAAMASINYFVQLTMVRENVQAGTYQNLEFFIMDNPNSVTYAIDILAYFFLSLSSLSQAWVFGGGRLKVSIRWLLAATGILGTVGFAGFALKNSIASSGVLLSGITYLVATVLLVFVFRRELSVAKDRTAPTPMSGPGANG